MIELTFLCSMIIILGLVVKQILASEEGYLLTLPIPIVGLIFGYYFTNYRSKRIQRVGGDLFVKPLFNKIKVYNNDNIKGYETYETFDRTGLVKQIRLIDYKDRKVIFVRDSYNDYDRVMIMIKSCGFKNLGEREFKWKIKRQYGVFVSICFVLAMMMYCLTRINWK